MVNRCISGCKQDIKTVTKILLTVISVVAGAENSDWEEAELRRDRITVKYRITEREDSSGNRLQPLIEYSASSVEKLNFDKCVALMKDVSRHKEFMESKSSELISTLSDSSWIIYYHYPSAGPIPEADAVMNFSYSTEDEGKSAAFIIEADPALIPKKDMKRVALDYEVFRFRDLGNGEVAVSMEVKTIPAMNVPQWMLNLAFPGAAGDIIKNIRKIVKRG